MGVNESAKYQLAKTFTELAIQNDLIDKRATATATAEEVTNFFNKMCIRDSPISVPSQEIAHHGFSPIWFMISTLIIVL